MMATPPWSTNRLSSVGSRMRIRRQTRTRSKFSTGAEPIHALSHMQHRGILCEPIISRKDTHIHTHPFNGLFSGTTRVSRYQKDKPFWILLMQETVSGSGISWAICKSAPRSRHIIMPAPHHSVFYRPDALPAAQPTASKH